MIVGLALVIVRSQNDHFVDISGKFISFAKTRISTWDQNAKTYNDSPRYSESRCRSDDNYTTLWIFSSVSSGFPRTQVPGFVVFDQVSSILAR